MDSNKLFKLANQLNLRDLPIMSSYFQTWIIMQTDSKSPILSKYFIICSFLDYLTILFTHFTIYFLSSDNICKTWLLLKLTWIKNCISLLRTVNLMYVIYFIIGNDLRAREKMKKKLSGFYLSQLLHVCFWSQRRRFKSQNIPVFLKNGPLRYKVSIGNQLRHALLIKYNRKVQLYLAVYVSITLEFCMFNRVQL